MLLSIIGLSLISHVFGALDCDRVEYTYRSSITSTQYKVVVALGVCFKTGSSIWPSEMYVCDSEGNVVEANFDDDACQERDSLTRDFRTEVIDYYNITSYEATCCSGNVCDYAIEKEYTSLTCEEEVAIDGTYREEEVYIIGSCQGDDFWSSYDDTWDTKKYISCDDGEVVYAEYDTMDCSGTPETANATMTCAVDSLYDDRFNGYECGTAMDVCDSPLANHAFQQHGFNIIINMIIIAIFGIYV